MEQPLTLIMLAVQNCGLNTMVADAGLYMRCCQQAVLSYLPVTCEGTEGGKPLATEACFV